MIKVRILLKLFLMVLIVSAFIPISSVMAQDDAVMTEDDQPVVEAVMTDSEGDTAVVLTVLLPLYSDVRELSSGRVWTRWRLRPSRSDMVHFRPPQPGQVVPWPSTQNLFF